MEKQILNFTSQFEIFNNDDEINKIAGIYIHTKLFNA